MRNYLGLSSEKDKGYAYVIVLCASIWSGLSLGLRLWKVQGVKVKKWFDSTLVTCFELRTSTFELYWALIRLHDQFSITYCWMESELRYDFYQAIKAHWLDPFHLDVPFQTAGLHALFCIFGRYSSRVLVTALLDKYPIRFWTILSVSCLVGSFILVYFAGFYATRDNFVYTQVIFGLLHGIGTGTGQLIDVFQL